MDSFRVTISVHVAYKLLYLHFKTNFPFSRKSLLFCFSHQERDAPIKQPYREELFSSLAFAQVIAVGLPRGDNAFCPLSKKSQVSFPRVLSLFKMRTQCSDTTLSLVRAVLGTDETLDCWLLAPDIRDLSRYLRSRCCIPRETSTYTEKHDKARTNGSCLYVIVPLKNCFLAYTTCCSGSSEKLQTNSHYPYKTTANQITLW